MLDYFANWKMRIEQYMNTKFSTCHFLQRRWDDGGKIWVEYQVLCHQNSPTCTALRMGSKICWCDIHTSKISWQLRRLKQKILYSFKSRYQNICNQYISHFGSNFSQSLSFSASSSSTEFSQIYAIHSSSRQYIYLSACFRYTFFVKSQHS